MTHQEDFMGSKPGNMTYLLIHVCDQTFEVISDSLGWGSSLPLTLAANLQKQ